MGQRNKSITPGLTLRAPTAADAGSIWHAVRRSGVLEPNSSYAYVLLCTHFADTSIVAIARNDDIDDEELAGFVVGYRPPGAADTLFVWQVGVTQAWQGRGLGKRMLSELLSRPAQAEVRYLEATVEPSNEPSRRLFTAVARQVGADYEVSDHFGSDLFAEQGHGSEDLFRIGPFSQPDRAA